MSYFPAFINLEQKRVLIVGGGNIAFDKLEKLLDFTKEITIITKETTPKLAQLVKDNCLRLLIRPYREGDIKDFDIVIVATDNIELHKRVYEESRSYRVLVNSVDNTKYCDFIFPSYVKRGNFTIAFSTSGASPAFAKHIKRYFEEIIPENIDEFLEKMKKLRVELPKGRERMEKFDKMAKEFVDRVFRKL